MAATSICDIKITIVSPTSLGILTLNCAIHSCIYPGVKNYAVSNTVLCLQFWIFPYMRVSEP